MNYFLLLSAIMLMCIAVIVGTNLRIFEMPKWFSNPPPSFELIRRQSSKSKIFWIPAEAQFPKEWAERSVNVQQFNKMPKGGHFAALEEPELWVKEITSFFYK